MDVGFGLGSNIGDKAANIRAALRALDASGALRDLVVSPLYRTAPWGKVDQDWFVNACAAGATDETPEALLQLCLDIERRMGRVRGQRWGPRLIDIDLLYCGTETRDAPGLGLPHPELLNRAFVLVPLYDLRPDLVVRGESLRAALARLDTGDVVRLPQQEA